MLCELPPDQYRVFSGVAPLAVGEGMGFEPHTALVHADAGTPDVAELIAEMAGAHRHRLPVRRPGFQPQRAPCSSPSAATATSRARARPAACSAAGLSGVAFGEGVSLVSRVTQGCQPVAAQRVITAAEGNVITELDGEPALDVLLRDTAHLAGPAAGRDGGVARHAGGPDRSRRRRRGPHRQLRRRRGGAPHHRPGSRRAAAWPSPTRSRPACAWLSASATRRPPAPT